MFDRRKAFILGMVGAVIVAAIAYGVVRMVQGNDPYAGLTLWRETEIDEATRFSLEQRIAATQTAVDAALQRGEEVAPELYLSLAQDAYVLGDLVSAREALEESINQNSLNSAVWNTYASTLEDMGAIEDAGLAYTEAINKGGNTEFYMDYVRFLQKHYPERTEDIKSTLEHGIARLGRNATFVIALGEWYWQDGDCTRAQDHYEIAAELSPGNEGIAARLSKLKAECVEK